MSRLLLSSCLLIPVAALSAVRATAAAFEPRYELAVGNTPLGVAVGDLDGDGRLDVIVGAHEDDSVVIYPNVSAPGSLGFGTPVQVGTGLHPQGIAIRDLDGDGRDEVITADSGRGVNTGTVSVLRNTSVAGAISLTRSVALELDTAHRVVSADFDGDGRPDLAATSNSGGIVAVFRNIGPVGSLAFARVGTLNGDGSPLQPIAVGDLDGDSRPDLIITMPSSNRLGIYRNLSNAGSIAFGAMIDFPMPVAPHAIDVADMNQDGKLDLVIANQSGTVSAFPNTSSGTGNISMGPRVDAIARPGVRELAVGDLDGDGRPDVAVGAATSADVVVVLRNESENGEIILTSDEELPGGPTPFSTVVTDVDGDGANDIVVSNYGGITASILRNTHAPVGRCASAPAGIVSWWPGDNNALDAVGHNNGAAVNGASYGPGLVNSAFTFDGTNDYVNAFSESSSFFSNSEAFTLEAWFQAESETSSYFILRNAAFGLRWQGSSSSLDFYNGTDHFSSRASWELGRWYHVALVDDGKSNVRLYIDGVLDKSDDGTLRNPNRFPCHPSGYCFELQFGGYYETHDVEYFRGQVDEVTLYNRALTAAEIYRVFLSGRHGKCLLPSTTAVRPGDILVADPGALGGRAALIKVDPITGVQEIVSSGGLFALPRGIAVDSAGQIIVADQNAFGGGGGVIKVDPVTGNQTEVSSGGYFVDPLAVTLDAQGDIIVADAGPPLGTGTIIKVNPVTGAQTIISTGGLFVDPHGIAFDAGGNIVVAEHHIDGVWSGAIIGVNPITGAQALVSSGGLLIRLVHVAVAPSGDILVASLGFNGPLARIVSVNPSTGAQTAVTSEGVLVSPSGIGFDASGDILVADQDAFGGPGGVIQVDALTGVQTVLSAGGLFVDPVGLAVYPADATGSSRVLDNFNRADGELGANWSGFSDGLHYLIHDEAGQAWYGGPAYWRAGGEFGARQEAFVTLKSVVWPEGYDNALMLKIQGEPVPANPSNEPDWIKGCIVVSYNAVDQSVYVATWQPGSEAWHIYASQRVSMADGDKFGARVLANGDIKVFRNETQVAAFTLDAADQSFFNGRGGRIGLWFDQAATAQFDDFGGGTVMP